MQGNAVMPEVGSYKRRKIGISRIVAFVPDDGDVVQGNAFAYYVGSYNWNQKVRDVQGRRVCA